MAEEKGGRIDVRENLKETGEEMKEGRKTGVKGDREACNK